MGHACDACSSANSTRFRPNEAGADISKITMGGVMGQCDKDEGVLRILMDWSAPLSEAQSQGN